MKTSYNSIAKSQNKPNKEWAQVRERMLITNHQGKAKQNHGACYNGCHQRDRREMVARMWATGHPWCLLLEGL